LVVSVVAPATAATAVVNPKRDLVSTIDLPPD
jgi:hypothetical protein